VLGHPEPGGALLRQGRVHAADPRGARLQRRRDRGAEGRRGRRLARGGNAGDLTATISAPRRATGTGVQPFTRREMTSSGNQIISAAAHVVEPADLFATTGLGDRAPKLTSVDGGDAWIVEGADPVPLPPLAATGSAYRVAPGNEDAPISFGDVMPALYDPAE